MNHKNQEPTNITIDQTTLIHDELSFRTDFKLTKEDINVLEYQWFALPKGHSAEGAVMASCLGLEWQGVQA
ncbi:MAG: hypothetical protein ABW090_16130 [Sedimenticola sp.]